MSHELNKRIITSVFLIFLLAGMYFYSFIMLSALIIIALITWVEFYALISKIVIKDSIKDKFLRFIYKAISLLYLTLLVWFILYIESHQINLKVYLLYSILVAILSDIGGLIFGRILKGKKLTKISPNKTIWGSIGSFIFSLSLILLFSEELKNYDFSTLVFITIIISLVSQLGDLFISFLKRKAKVKDTSNILPGHGGFLDRIDGIIFASPIGVILFIIL
jgi:phosphatidate cytidylyltransferase